MAIETELKLTLPVDIERQPTDSTCGATCLQAIYKFWGDHFSVTALDQAIPQLRGGGTLAVQLGCHALELGYQATIHTYNIQVFDPTWFAPQTPKGSLETRSIASSSRQKSCASTLAERLTAQLEIKGNRDARLAPATSSYLRFLELGGDVSMEPFNRNLIKQQIAAGRPILAGLSATILYQEMRERPQPPCALGLSAVSDDVGGDPAGHFVVLSGYDETHEAIRISDPLHSSPETPARDYWAPIDHVASAIFLGILTFDSNLLVLEKPEPDNA